MKKNILISTAMVLALSTMLQAGGGKNLSPAISPIAPVEVAPPVFPWYLGVGALGALFAVTNCNESPGCDYEDQTYGMMVRGGYDYNKYIGVEARYLRTAWDEGPYGGAPLVHAGLFLKPQYPVTSNVNVYGLAGYGYTKNLGNGNRLNYFDDAWGFSAGGGVEYNFAGNGRNGWSLFTDYQRILIESDVPSMNAVSMGIRYTF